MVPVELVEQSARCVLTLTLSGLVGMLVVNSKLKAEL